jgi:beta-phosphoglucomutase
MSTIKPTPAIIWDMDGVLIDSGDLHYYTWRDVLREQMGMHLTRERFDSTFGADNFNTLTQLMGSPPTAEQLELLAGRKEAVYRDEMHLHVRPIEPSIALVEELHRRGWKQIVATSAPRANVVAMMDVFSFDRWFDSFVCVDDVSNGKPAPDVFLKAAERLGVLPGACVVIEDSRAGVQAAHTAGMACLAITTSYPAEALSMADRVVESLAAITPDDLIALVNGSDRAGAR